MTFVCKHHVTVQMFDGSVFFQPQFVEMQTYLWEVLNTHTELGDLMEGSRCTLIGVAV